MTRPTQLRPGDVATRETMFVYTGAETVSGVKTVQTGLDTVAVALAGLDQDPSISALYANAKKATQADEPGQIELTVMKPTNASNPTPTTATGAALVQWIAIGNRP